MDYFFETLQRLKFCVYDIDNDTYDLGDDDFLGELECTLGQVSFLIAFLCFFCASSIISIYITS